MALAVIPAASMAIAACVAVKRDLSWPAAGGMFYGLVALLQIAYLGLVVARERDAASGRPI